MKIRRLADHEKITEPGFYEISLERHHSQPCDGVSVTSGVLRNLYRYGPSKVWATHQLNPNRFTPKSKNAFKLGTAMALMVEGGLDALKTKFFFREADTPNRPTVKQIAAYDEGRGTEAGIRSVEFWRRVDASGLNELTLSESEMIAEMALVLGNDPGARDFIQGSQIEVTMASLDEETGIWLLGRPDVIRIEGSGSLLDYKKISTQGRPFTGALCDQRIGQYGYDMQIAFGRRTFRDLMGFNPAETGLIFQEDEPGYDVLLREISEGDLELCERVNQQMLRDFKTHLVERNWPSIAQETAVYMMHDKRREHMLNITQNAA